jgi:hypothetical protein
MTQKLINFFQFFGQVTHVEISPFLDSVCYVSGFILLCIIISFFGFRLYRVIFSLVMLVLTILVTVLLLEGMTEWLYIATTFSIFSVVIAFLSYFSKKIAAFVLVGLIVFGYGLSFNIGVVYSILIGVLLGGIAYLLPFVSVVLSTTILGSIEGVVLLFSLMNYQMNPILFIIGLIIISISFQIFTNREELDKLKKLRDRYYG